MIKTPLGNKFWISPDGEAVNGPYTLAQIANMHKFAPMSPETPMQAEGANSWSTLSDWLPETREESRAAAAAARKEATQIENSGSDSGTNARKIIIGLVLLAAAALMAVYVFFVL